MARTRCALHGGKTPQGFASPHFKHGKYSRYAIPRALAAAFERSLKEPEVLELTEGIALTDALASSALERLEAGDVVDFGAAEQALRAFDCANLAGDVTGAGQALAALRHAVETGIGREGAVRQVLLALEAGRRLRGTEMVRVKMASEVMTRDQVYGLIGFIMEVLREICSPEQLGKISDALRRRLATGSLAGPDEGETP